MPIEENDYPFKSHRYIAVEKKVVSWLCAQDRIEPNHITLFRFLICIILFLFSSQLTYVQLLILAALGAVSDFFDGALARAASKKTRLGILIDPLADKFLVFTIIYILLIRKAIDPGYVVFMIIMETHLVIIPMFSWVYGLIDKREKGISSTAETQEKNAFITRSKSLLIGKMKFLFYSLALLSILLGRAIGSSILLTASDWLLVAGITTGAIAFFTYLFKWLKNPHKL